MEPLAQVLAAKDAGDLESIADDDALWLELGEQQKAAMRPQAEAMVRAGMLAAEQTFGLAPTVGIFRAPVDTAVRQTVDTYLDEWWLALSHNERTLLRARFRRLAAGELAGGFPQLRRSVEDLFGRDRGRLIAETETTRLWAMGNEISMSQSGVAEYEWRTANDDRVDDVCNRLDGQRFPVNGNGPRPPAHPRCRCAIIPAVAELPPVPEHETPPSPPTPQPEPGETRPPSGPQPIDLGSLRAVKGVRGKAGERARAINQVFSDRMRALSPSERALLEATDRELGVGAGRQAAGVNEWNGRIGFNARYVDDEIVPLANNPRLIADPTSAGDKARHGWKLVEHEMTHGIAPTTRSHNFTRLRPDAKLRERWRRGAKFAADDWTDDQIDQAIVRALDYQRGIGQRIEEGTTDAIARDRLRLELIDNHGLPFDEATALAERSGTRSYNGYVQSMRDLADEALRLEGAEFSLIGEGRALDGARRERAAWVRALGNEIPAVDRYDALTRYFMEKWTVEIGPISSTTAAGAPLGLENSFRFYEQLRDAFYSGTRGGNLGLLPAMNKQGIEHARLVWQQEAEAFARTVRDNIRDGILDPVDPVAQARVFIPEEFAEASQMPSSWAASLPRRPEVTLQ